MFRDGLRVIDKHGLIKYEPRQCPLTGNCALPLNWHLGYFVARFFWGMMTPVYWQLFVCFTCRRAGVQVESSPHSSDLLGAALKWRNSLLRSVYYHCRALARNSRVVVCTERAASLEEDLEHEHWYHRSVVKDNFLLNRSLKLLLLNHSLC